MLTVKNLSKSYQSLQAVSNLSFEINAGEIVGLIGPNGAGKTTTLRCICGILKPDVGQINAGGFDLFEKEINAKKLMAFIPETPNPYDLLTVREHIQFIAMCYGTMESFNARINDLLERFELKEKENELVVSLSKGMKQKLTLACAFVHNAKIFLCDEPMMGINPKGQYTIKTELQRLRDEGCAILVSTHQLDTAERLCDRVIILQKGQKIAEGTLDELKKHSNSGGVTLEEVFLHLTDEAQ